MDSGVNCSILTYNETREYISYSWYCEGIVQITLAALCLSVQFLTLYILVAGNFLQNIFYSLILLLTSFSIVYSLICLWDSLAKIWFIGMDIHRLLSPQLIYPLK